TDNPWGDRQEAMTREEFAATLRGGLGHVHRVGTGFEYSNTSYALLGRVIDEITAGDYASVIRRRFLVPLGLGATGWSAEEIDSSRLATGHRLADRTDATRFEPVPLDAPAASGAMAGFFPPLTASPAWFAFFPGSAAPAPGRRPPARPAAPRFDRVPRDGPASTVRGPGCSPPSTTSRPGCAPSPRPTPRTPPPGRPARWRPPPAARCSSCTATTRWPPSRRT